MHIIRNIPKPNCGRDRQVGFHGVNSRWQDWQNAKDNAEQKHLIVMKIRGNVRSLHGEV